VSRFASGFASSFPSVLRSVKNKIFLKIQKAKSFGSLSLVNKDQGEAMLSRWLDGLIGQRPS
jgi:hypothetical protein